MSDHRVMRSSLRRPSPVAHALIAVLIVALTKPAGAFAGPLVLVPTTTLAATGPKISVLVVSLDAKSAAQQGAIEGAAEEALDRAARFTVVKAHDALNPAGAKKRADATTDAREKMKAGKQALDDLDNVKATESFTAALEGVQGADLSTEFPAVLDAWTMRAAGYATGGENNPAKKDIEAVVGLNAKAEFSATFFPPELIKFAEVSRKQAANAKGELLVRTEPAGARVWVDGTFRGISPVTVAGLSNVKHFVTASLGGYALGQTQATPGEEVISMAAAELGPGWKKATSDIKKDSEGATRDLAAQTLGKAAQLDQLLLVVAKKSLAGEKLDLIALRLETRDQHNAAYKAATVGASDAEGLASFFDSLTGADQKRDGKNPVHHFKGGGGSDLKTIASVSLLGLGAAGIVSGVVFGVLANGNANAFKTTPQTQRLNSDTLAREGRTFAVVADVSYLIGIAAGATGGVLLITDKLGGGSDSAPADEPKKKNGKAGVDELKKKETDRKAAEDRRASEERRKEDERRREEEKKRDEDKKADAKNAEEKKKKEAEEEEARKKAEEEAANKKLTKKEKAALEKKKREDEERQRKEEEKQRKEDEKRAAEEKKKQEAEEREKEKNAGKLTKKQREEEERKKKEEEEAAAARKKAEDEERAKKEAEEKKKEEERKKKEEEDKKKKPKDDDHDDLRNY